MVEGVTILRVVSLAALLKAIGAEGGKWGRFPTRISASPTQVRRWETDLRAMHPTLGLRDPAATVLTIWGIVVTEGAADCRPEIIWASPIEEVA